MKTGIINDNKGICRMGLKLGADNLMLKVIFDYFSLSFQIDLQNHYNLMSNHNTHAKIEPSSKNHSHQLKSQPIDSKYQNNQTFNNQTQQFHHPGIFLTHEQKIQATYNFQHLFRKKSHIYNLHKNKKKLLNKNKCKQSTLSEDPDKQSKNVKKGHWTQQENKKYHWFLELYNKNFIYKHLRRTDKIFKAMSSFIGTREAQQCRSHHQKMQKKFKHFYQIILKLRMQFYGTCNTEAIKGELQQSGYIKQTKDLLVEQNIMKEMQNTNDLDNSSEKEQIKKSHSNDQVVSMQEKEYDSQEQEEDNFSNNNKEKQVHMLLGQNYQQEFNYKMY